jgi:hypothetical protein
MHRQCLVVTIPGGLKMQKTLAPEAQRALAEAEARRKTQNPAALPKELSGTKDPEPTRFGDWEKKGIASDF